MFLPLGAPVTAKLLLEVSGDVDLFGGDPCVVQMVARDGIEPPTPAFSGLRSTN